MKRNDKHRTCRPFAGRSSMWYWLSAAMIALSIHPAAAATPDLSGDWFTEGVEDGQFLQLIQHRHPSGAFEVDIRVLDQCRPIDEWVESGDWSYKNNEIDQNTTEVKGAKAMFHDTYKIVSEVNTTYLAYDPSTAITWKMIRVSGDFVFPSPDQCATS